MKECQVSRGIKLTSKGDLHTFSNTRELFTSTISLGFGCDTQMKRTKNKRWKTPMPTHVGRINQDESYMIAKGMGYYLPAMVHDYIEFA